MPAPGTDVVDDELRVVDDAVLRVDDVAEVVDDDPVLVALLVADAVVAPLVADEAVVVVVAPGDAVPCNPTAADGDGDGHGDPVAELLDLDVEVRVDVEVDVAEVDAVDPALSAFELLDPVALVDVPVVLDRPFEELLGEDDPFGSGVAMAHPLDEPAPPLDDRKRPAAVTKMMKMK